MFFQRPSSSPVIIIIISMFIHVSEDTSVWESKVPETCPDSPLIVVDSLNKNPILTYRLIYVESLRYITHYLCFESFAFKPEST